MALDTEDKDVLAKGKPSMERQQGAAVSRLRPGLSDRLAGETKGFVRELQPYLPQDLIGGTVPHIPGMEEEAVWNAASQACGTEKIHFCYSIDEGRVWYLACPSSSLASNPDSWCPLAAALPGHSEYWDQETVYLYEQEGLASALRWDPETGRMQVFLGASRTILPRVQSMDANFVIVNPEAADVIPWRNRMLKTEQLSRATTRMLLFTGMGVCLLAMLILGANYLSINMMQRNLAQVQRDSKRASDELMLKAHSGMQNDTVKHLVRIQEILDSMTKVEGTLVRYEVKAGKLEWEALLSPAFAGDYGTPMGLEKDGRARIKNNR